MEIIKLQMGIYNLYYQIKIIKKKVYIIYWVSWWGYTYY